MQQDRYYSRDFVLPLPPSDNELYLDPRWNRNKRNPSGRRIPINREWANEFKVWGPRPKIDGKRPVWGVSGRLLYPTSRLWRSDIQNRFKLFFDAMSEWLGIGDRYVVINGPWVKWHTNKTAAAVQGRLEVWASYEEFLSTQIPNYVLVSGRA